MNLITKFFVYKLDFTNFKLDIAPSTLSQDGEYLPIFDEDGYDSEPAARSAIATAGYPGSYLVAPVHTLSESNT